MAPLTYRLRRCGRNSGAGQGRTGCRGRPGGRKLEAFTKPRKKECHGIHPGRIRASGSLPDEGRSGARRRRGRARAPLRAGALARPPAVRPRPDAHPGQSSARVPDPVGADAAGGNHVRDAARRTAGHRRAVANPVANPVATPTATPADETPGTWNLQVPGGPVSAAVDDDLAHRVVEGEAVLVTVAGVGAVEDAELHEGRSGPERGRVLRVPEERVGLQEEGRVV